ncbi:hypothetical protein AB0M86_44375 [Streptomyces sp. NPDC051639]|uniref:hypothetical protein n=1 Tax=Streptomyces sp. NPDC051639 TaxID=3155671 RepID=UPI00341DE6BF
MAHRRAPGAREAVGAGLTRPTGIAVAAAVIVTALLGRRHRFSSRALVAAVLAPAGRLAYVGRVGSPLGRWDGYLTVQSRWHNEWDGGAETLRRMREVLVTDSTRRRTAARTWSWCGRARPERRP